MNHLIACEPPWFARGGHRQTLLGFLWPVPRLAETGEIWRIPLPDGDRLFARVHDLPSASKILVLFHGLGGDIDSNYMHLSAALAAKLGWSCVRVNLRGAGEGFALAEGLYHSGRSEDVSDVLGAVRARWPGRTVVLAGFSLSGNVVLNLLGGYQGDQRPDAAVVFNPALHLVNCSGRLSARSGTIYDVSFVRDLRALVARKRAAGLWRGPDSLPARLSVARFDDLVTAPAAGFRDAQEYYRVCSAWQRVGRIDVPSVVITAADDPLVPAEDFRTAKWSSATRVRIEPFGGHLGYLMKDGTGARRWLPLALEAAFRELSLL